MKNDENIEEN